jgi:kynureninase
MIFENNLSFAQKLDNQDSLKNYREQFKFPQVNNKNVIYFTGNSLGLQPKIANDYVNEVMQDWANLAVEGHFYAQKPWWDYQDRLCEPLAKIIGAKVNEVTVMNTLTINLHLLMVSFYTPTKDKFKIICEEKAFPSDQYMIQSQVKWHGFDPQEAIIEVKRRENEHNIREEDILETLLKHKDSTALFLFGGVNYYTGQVFDMQKITAFAKSLGITVGWDLAHAAGNVILNLHDWDVDFAAWCSYKYMNSGPGNASGCFVHEKHHNNKKLNRLAGWWGHNKKRRFLMEQNFDPEEGADGWQVSNLPILSLAPYLASLELFNQVGMESLIKKRDLLTAYLNYILDEIDKETPNTLFEIITPTGNERACQLSVYLHGQGRSIFEYLMKNGVITDWREPNVIRLAPVPFYCSFEDMFQFGQILKKGLLNKL